jgi:GNAT superfamily N-acetyltransferase
MSRSGYSDDLSETELNLYRGAVESAIRGRRGQAFLRELLAELDAMPVKELIVGRLENAGAYCALGVVGHARGLPLHELDSDEEDDGYNVAPLARAFGVARALVAEIEFVNDERGWRHTETRAELWSRMRAWVVEQIKVPT